MIGGIAVGLWKAPGFGPFHPAERTVYSPRMEDGERERLYRGWKQAVAMVVNRRAQPE
jgi:glycerol kinase